MTETTDTTTGIPGKGGYSQAVQPVFSENPSSSYGDIDTGSGYYRNPYSSGYGMGYQDPYAGMRYTPQRGLMGPSGFGGKGGYSQPMPSPYGLPLYGGMSPSKGGYSPQAMVGADGGTPYYNPEIGPSGESLYDSAGDTSPPLLSSSLAGVGLANATPEQLTASADPLYSDVVEGVPVTNTMDIADADPTQTLQGAAIASDGSNVVDFTPYAGDEFVRIGDQVVSRADLQRRGSDYYTRPIQAPPMRRQQYPMYGGKGGYYR